MPESPQVPPTLVADRGNSYGGTVHHVHDADTVVCSLWDSLVQVYVLVAVRLRGVQGPELADPGGQQVRAALAERLPVGATVMVGDVGPYPRPGHITATVGQGGVDMTGWLLERGYAVAWDGRGPKPAVPWPPVPLG